ncbi:MAG: ubiquinone/menaquinone biosynthesis methyltransferase [Candidatus Hodarchaeota archaeon]
MILDKSPNKTSRMFNRIAFRYDLLNNVISAFTHKRVRIFALKLMNFEKRSIFLDLATGTGDFAFLLRRASKKTSQVIGVDLSLEMLVIAKKKKRKKRIGKYLEFLIGDVTQLPFANNTFDGCSIVFGLRNLHQPQKALKEFLRVSKRGGSLVIAEATSPAKPKFRFLSNFYFTHLVPLIARLLLSDPSAYNYLAQSIAEFPQTSVVSEMMQKTGWIRVRYFRMLFGSATLFLGIKP